MPTLLSHAIVGGALASVAPAGVSPWRLAAALAALSVLPDVDVVAFGLGIPYGHPLGHRGLSHSLTFAALAGAVLGWSMLPGGPPRARLRVGLLGFAACASHGVLDALTDGGRGVGFLIPFDDARYFFPWRPLRVSPIGVDAFFASRAAGRILRQEALFVLLPVISVACLAAWWRRRGSR